MVMAFVLCMGNEWVFAAGSQPAHIIHVVYDDSTSMIVTDGKTVDTWCQAKYAMEVFAAMLGENDRMNIYVMSDFSEKKKGNAKLRLNGASGPEENVAKVHHMLTQSGNTPFETVEKAYNDLKSAKADNKWLVVLTDGEFQHVDTTVDDYFAKKAKDVKVMYLAMGANAGGIKENAAKNIYFEKASSNSQIIQKITGICNTIFERNRLNVDVGSQVMSFDVPMNELIVFAQGAHVAINAIKQDNGTVHKCALAPVEVKYSEKPSTNADSFIVNKNLKGSIATFKGDFTPGQYTVDVTGAASIEVYYKPNVEAAVFLTDADGNDVSDRTDLKKGEYTLTYGFVKAGTKETVPNSPLLGDVSFSASVSSDGGEAVSCESGSKIALDPGTAEISVNAHYLDRNNLRRKYTFHVFNDKSVAFRVLDNPTYRMTTSGFDQDRPVTVQATVDGEAVSEEQWKSMGVPKVEIIGKDKRHIDSFRVEKSDEPGVYRIYPQLTDGKPAAKAYSDLPCRVTFEEMHDPELWSGESGFTLNISEMRSWLDIHRALVKRLIGLGILFAVVLGYVPGVKKYLPKKLKRRPLVETKLTQRRGAIKSRKPQHSNGLTRRSVLTTIIPYIPQTGRIIYVPYAERGIAPELHVKATGGNRMLVTNLSEFINRKNITFDEEYMQDGQTRKSITAGCNMGFERKGMKYSCRLNQEKE